MNEPPKTSYVSEKQRLKERLQEHPEWNFYVRSDHTERVRIWAEVLSQKYTHIDFRDEIQLSNQRVG